MATHTIPMRCARVWAERDDTPSSVHRRVFDPRARSRGEWGRWPSLEPAAPTPGRPGIYPCRIPRSVRRDDIQFPAKHSALRDDVHVLGALVGDVLKEQGGEALFELVEKDRRLSIRRRAGDKDAAAELGVQLRGRAPHVARDLARAFSMWFRAVNLAEKVHRIRRRRGYFIEASERAQPGGVEAALLALKSRGLQLADILELLKKIRIEPVFTAHPTESA